MPDGRSTWFWMMLNAAAVVKMLWALDLAMSMPVSWPNQEASHRTSESAKSVPERAVVATSAKGRGRLRIMAAAEPA